MTCIVTGAGSGIGRAAATELGRRGYFRNLVLVGRRRESLEETSRLLPPECRSETLVFDITRLDAIPAMVADIHARFGDIRCLLNIAGFAAPQPLLTTTAENLLQTYTTNVFAPLILARECAKHMRRLPGAKIVNVASTAATSARPGWIGYASSKAAVVSLSSTLSEELAEYGIKVYCLSPGRCATALRRLLAPAENPDDIMQPDVVGSVIADLVAPGEQYLDGQNIIVRKR